MWVDLLPACAPTVHPITMAEVVRVEHGSPPALHVNGLPANKQPHARIKDEAVALASDWRARGYSVDLGLCLIQSGPCHYDAGMIPQIRNSAASSDAANGPLRRSAYIPSKLS
jgi:hypothetical protein